eukprot:Seg1190.8 transcript_id=Seg1190.8/GoldUCD/mRNA.D3Y31 product="hypothetical protein" pseudo=true protein_id=Seg1190.8/GoldUCD/D3Y31
MSCIFQRNQAGISTGMEFYSFKNCLRFIPDNGCTIDTLVSDGHQTIAAFMRDNHPDVKHRFDLWHIKKSKFL